MPLNRAAVPRHARFSGRTKPPLPRVKTRLSVTTNADTGHRSLKQLIAPGIVGRFAPLMVVVMRKSSMGITCGPFPGHYRLGRGPFYGHVAAPYFGVRVSVTAPAA